MLLLPNAPVNVGAVPDRIRAVAQAIGDRANEGDEPTVGIDPLTIIALISLIVNILWYCKPDKLSRVLRRIQDRPYGPIALTYRVLFWSRMPKHADCRLLWPAAVAVGCEQAANMEQLEGLSALARGMSP